MYFFTPLHKIRSNETRVKRNTKHGFGELHKNVLIFFIAVEIP